MRLTCKTCENCRLAESGDYYCKKRHIRIGGYRRRKACELYDPK